MLNKKIPKNNTESLRGPDWARTRPRPVDAASSVVFGGEISPNFDLKNMISTFTKDFSMQKRAQIHQISKKNQNRQIFMMSFSR